MPILEIGRLTGLQIQQQHLQLADIGGDVANVFGHALRGAGHEPEEELVVRDDDSGVGQPIAQHLKSVEMGLHLLISLHLNMVKSSKSMALRSFEIAPYTASSFSHSSFVEVVAVAF